MHRPVFLKYLSNSIDYTELGLGDKSINAITLLYLHLYIAEWFGQSAIGYLGSLGSNRREAMCFIRAGERLPVT